MMFAKHSLVLDLTSHVVQIMSHWLVPMHTTRNHEAQHIRAPQPLTPILTSQCLVTPHNLLVLLLYSSPY